jgi:hypothetical protein
MGWQHEDRPGHEGYVLAVELVGHTWRELGYPDDAAPHPRVSTKHSPLFVIGALSALALASACSTETPKESGDEQGRTCPAQSEALSNPDDVVPSIGISANEAIALVERPLAGSLTLANGDEVPLVVKVAAVAGSLRSYKPDQAACEDWIGADVSVNIDAGSVMKGTSTGEIRFGTLSETRGKTVDADAFTGSITLPEFQGDVVAGPFIVVSLAEKSSDVWEIDVQAAAAIASSDQCDPKRDSECATGPSSTSGTTSFLPIGSGELRLQ